VVGVHRKERKDSDYSKTMFRATVGGGGARGVKNQRGQACLWSCYSRWTNGTYCRLSVVGGGVRERCPPQLMPCWEWQMLGTAAVLPPSHGHD